MNVYVCKCVIAQHAAWYEAVGGIWQEIVEFIQSFEEILSTRYSKSIRGSSISLKLSCFSYLFCDYLLGFSWMKLMMMTE